MQNTTADYTITSGEALADRRRVKLSAGKVVYADATDEYIGITQAGGVSAADKACSILLKGPGSREMVAAGAITANANVYAADDGKVAATGSILVGQAREAATADGDVIEVLPNVEAAESDPGLSISAVDNTDGTATVTIEANSRKLIRFWTATAGAFGAVAAATTSIAATTGTVLTSHTAHGNLELVTDADGDVVLTITAAADEWFLHAEANGQLVSTSVTITDV